MSKAKVFAGLTSVDLSGEFPAPILARIFTVSESSSENQKPSAISLSIRAEARTCEAMLHGEACLLQHAGGHFKLFSKL